MHLISRDHDINFDTTILQIFHTKEALVQGEQHIVKISLFYTTHVTMTRHLLSSAYVL